jgi:ubiquinone/menaquinone biosynthesis C-methylase UbiE
MEQQTFRSFEHAGWKSVASDYHDHFASLTSQALRPLLDAVGAGPGVRVLDACTGPGYAAGAAAERGASVIGLDFSAPMVAHARRHSSGVRFLVGDAEQLPFASGSFDAVISNFGLLHLARPEQFLGEAHRVLRSGGRVGFTVWDAPEQAVGFAIVLSSIQEHGAAQITLPEGPPFFRFSDAEECRHVLERTGFAAPRVTSVPQLWRLPDPDSLFQAVLNGTVRTGGLLRAQTPQALKSIRTAMRAAVESRRHGDAFELLMPAVLASAVKP